MSADARRFAGLFAGCIGCGRTVPPRSRTGQESPAAPEAGATPSVSRTARVGAAKPRMWTHRLAWPIACATRSKRTLPRAARRHAVCCPRGRPPTFGSQRYSVSDTIVLSLVVLAAFSLILPALANSRYQARKAACQDNLRVLGEGLLSYSERDPGQRFPLVPISGSRSFAGVFAPILFEYEMIGPEGSQVMCPGSELAVGTIRSWSVPTLQEIDRAERSVLQYLQDRAGGSYAYSVGYIDDGQLAGGQELEPLEFRAGVRRAQLLPAGSPQCQSRGPRTERALSKTVTARSSRTCESCTAAMIRGGTTTASRKPGRIAMIPSCSPVACDRCRRPPEPIPLLEPRG